MVLFLRLPLSSCVVGKFVQVTPACITLTDKKVNVPMSVINECSCCREQSYLFDRVDIKHVGVDEGGRGKNMTRVCRLRSVFGME